MKIAVATDGTQVSAHAGRCEQYLVALVEGKRLVSRSTVPNPGHEPGRFPRLMRDLGVERLLVGGIGPRAAELLAGLGIDVVLVGTGDAEYTLRRYVAGELEGARNLCEH